MLQPLRDAAIRLSKRHPLRYQRALTTITPAIGRRTGAATNAVYLPSGDVVSFGRGNQVAGNFYQRVDDDQGTIIVKLTMEKPSTSISTTVSAFNNGTNSCAAMFQGSNGKWRFYFGGLYLETAADSFAQGDVRILIARWDRNRTLDGTNYLCLTINDSNTFGGTSQPAAPNRSYISIGAADTIPNASFPAIYEGFTVMRRVLYDGTYGVQVDNSADEMAAMYAAGAFADPASIVPSEDIVFQLNPLSSSGALTTTNEAWSFPHSSDLGDDAHLTQGFYGGAANAVGLAATTGIINMANTTPYNSLAGDMTAEIWLKVGGTETATGTILNKRDAGGWRISRVATTGNLYMSAIDSVAGTQFMSPVSVAMPQTWQHIALEYKAATKTFTLYLAGVAVGTLVIPNAVVSDVATALQIGAFPSNGNAAIGWCRISDTLRYGGAFTPPRACPANDGNTLGLWAMNEGTGTTVADGSANANDGTITGGTWVQPWEYEGTPSAVAVTAAANQVYAGGLSFTADAADEGIKFTLPCAAGADVWLEALMHTADGQCALVAYDVDNTTEIARVVGPLLTGAHDGADDAAVLSDASANWQLNALAGWTVANTTDGSSAVVVSNTATTITATLAGGTGNDWDTGDAFTLTPPSSEWVDHPTRLELTAEAPAGCTHIAVKCIDLVGSGTVFVHQVLAQANLLSNPSFETAGAGGADVFAGWTETAPVGSTLSRTTTAGEFRSGVAAVRLERATEEAYVLQASASVSGGRRIRTSFHTRGDGTRGGRFSYLESGTGTQLTGSSRSSTGVTGTAFVRLSAVYLVPATGTVSAYLFTPQLAGASYFDDVSLLLMDTVALTVTPAAASNTINGADTAVRVLSGQLGASHGEVEFWVTPTWSAALAARGQTRETLLRLYINDANYLRLQRTANTLTLIYVAQGGGTQTGTFDLTGLWAANVRRRCEVVWHPAGAYVLLDGAVVCNIAAACVFSAAFTSVYFGSEMSGVNNADALFE